MNRWCARTHSSLWRRSRPAPRRRAGEALWASAASPVCSVIRRSALLRVARCDDGHDAVRRRTPRPPVSQAAGGDVAVGGGGVDVQCGTGTVGVLQRVVDTAVGGAGVQGRKDPAGGADRDGAVLGAQGDGAAHGLGDLEVPLLGADLRVRAQPADRDVAGLEGEAGARGLVQLDRALRAVEHDVPEPPDAPELTARRLRLDARAGGQLDGHLDGAGRAEDPVARRGDLDPQHPVAVGHLGALRRLDVPALGGVGRSDVDGGVGPVGGDELDASGGDVEDDGDGGGGVELLHRELLGFVVSDDGNATLRSRLGQRLNHLESLNLQAKALISLQWHYGVMQRRPFDRCNELGLNAKLRAGHHG
ncbi:hypothetical protein SGPA1_11562 [Streptomyces misionensis JCM 4497]